MTGFFLCSDFLDFLLEILLRNFLEFFTILFPRSLISSVLSYPRCLAINSSVAKIHSGSLLEELFCGIFFKDMSDIDGRYPEIANELDEGGLGAFDDKRIRFLGIMSCAKAFVNTLVSTHLLFDMEPEN